jgi:hypothetical protein
MFKRKWHVMVVAREPNNNAPAREWSKHWTTRSAEHSVDKFMTTRAAVLSKAIIVHEDEMARFDEWAEAPDEPECYADRVGREWEEFTWKNCPCKDCDAERKLETT